MRYFILILALLITGCASYTPQMPHFLSPYKLDIQQGNVVTPKMMLQLRPEMTKAQVSFIMGTPLLTDSFHADRWDYFYQMIRDGKVLDQRRIILEFDGDTLKHVHGDVIPTGKEDGSMTVKPIIEPKADLGIRGTPGKNDEKSWVDKLKFWDDDGKAEPAVVEPKVEAQPEASPESAPVAAPLPLPPPAPANTPEAKPAQEKKGWLDKLKFWDSDDKKPQAVPAPAVAPAVEPKAEATPPPAPEPAPAPESKTEPVPEPVAAPEAKPEVAPEPTSAPAASTPEPAATPEPAPEAAPTPAPVPEAKPEVAPAPAPAPKPEVAPQPAPAAAPAPETAAQPKAQAKPTKPVPEAEKVAPTPKDLPPEDAPDYFERMLEKIGF
ncbi:MAG TPA: outer membrane protein assembly factor BamE [Methylophilaceae bacterium]|jgi:outer membrane protein assembly factor BamE